MYVIPVHEVKNVRLLGALLLCVLLSCQTSDTSSIKVAVASNARFVMEEISDAYRKQTGREVELIVSSSGKLTAQILEGAPYDVFLSADLDYPTTLYNQGKTTAKPVTYAYGTLCIWTTNENQNLDLNQLNHTDIRRIACANPKTAPYGKAAIEVLSNLGMYDSISNKLIYGESVSQVSQFVFSKAADVGFISSSMIHTAHLRDKGKLLPIDQALYSPIAQGAVVIKQEGKDDEIPLQFLQFLTSKDSKAILKKYGYRTN